LRKLRRDIELRSTLISVLESHGATAASRSIEGSRAALSGGVRKVP
jgi:hypothetical protein